MAKQRKKRISLSGGGSRRRKSARREAIRMRETAEEYGDISIPMSRYGQDTDDLRRLPTIKHHYSSLVAGLKETRGCPRQIDWHLDTIRKEGAKLKNPMAQRAVLRAGGKIARELEKRGCKF